MTSEYGTSGSSVTRWRQGGKVPLNVYEQLGDEPNSTPYPDGDRPVAMFHTVEDAALVVRAVNALLDWEGADA